MDAIQDSSIRGIIFPLHILLLIFATRPRVHTNETLNRKTEGNAEISAKRYRLDKHHLFPKMLFVNCFYATATPEPRRMGNTKNVSDNRDILACNEVP